MLRVLVRNQIRKAADKLGTGGLAAAYCAFATVTAAAMSIALSPSSDISQTTTMTASDFSRIGGAIEDAERFVTPTFDADFWNGGDMASDRHWKRTRRRVRVYRAPEIRIDLKPAKPSRKANSIGNALLGASEYGFGEGTFRRVCVRMCDGYYWPVSFNGERSLSKDVNVCQNSCSAPTRLFIDNNPGTDIDQMVDQSGRPYSKLKNAYRYRNEYVADCKCKSNPWEVASINRHKYYALVAQAKKSRVIAKVVKKQRRKIAVAKRKIRKKLRKEWRRIAKVEGFWAKAGDTRYSLGAKEVPYTDDNGYPIQVLSTRPAKRANSKYVRRLEPKLNSRYIRSENPFNGDSANFADPSLVLGRRKKANFSQTRMRLKPAASTRKPVVRRRRAKRPNWAQEAFSAD